MMATPAEEFIRFKARRDLAFTLFHAGMALRAASDQPHVVAESLVPEVVIPAADAMRNLRFNSRLTFDAVASISQVGVPLAKEFSHLVGTPCLALVEKQIKGENVLSFEGEIPASIRKLLLLDVLVAEAEPAFRAIRAFLRYDVIIVDVMALIERGRDSRKKLARRQYNLHSVFTTNELLDMYAPIPPRSV